MRVAGDLKHVTWVESCRREAEGAGEAFIAAPPVRPHFFPPRLSPSDAACLLHHRTLPKPTSPTEPSTGMLLHFFHHRPLACAMASLPDPCRRRPDPAPCVVASYRAAGLCRRGGCDVGEWSSSSALPLLTERR